jgi:hypothetical protein
MIKKLFTFKYFRDLNNITLILILILFFQLSQNIIFYKINNIYIKNWYFSFIYLGLIFLSSKRLNITKVEYYYIVSFIIIYILTCNLEAKLAAKNFFIWILPAIVGYILYKTKTPKLNYVLQVFSYFVFYLIVVTTIFIFTGLPDYKYVYSNGIEHNLYNSAPYYDYLIDKNSIRYTYPNIEHGYFGNMLFIPLIYLTLQKPNSKGYLLYLNQILILILFLSFYIIGSRAVFYGIIFYLIFIALFKWQIFKKFIIPFIAATILIGIINPAYILRYASPLYPLISKHLEISIENKSNLINSNPIFLKLNEKIKRHDDSHYHTSYLSLEAAEYEDRDYRPHGFIPNLILEIGLLSAIIYVATLGFLFLSLIILNFPKDNFPDNYIIGIAIFIAQLIKIFGNQNDGNYVFPIIFSIALCLINSKKSRF